MKQIIDDFKTAFKNCTYSAVHHKKLRLKQQLQQLADALGEDEISEVYGYGNLIEDFENEVAELLGKEAAVFLPSGTMAQPVALKVWSEAARSPYVGYHPTSHLQLHEQNGVQALWGLTPISLGSPLHVPTLNDIKHAANNRLAAILLELPMREIGGQLPSWDDLVAQSEWMKANDIKRHLDGARLWQCPAAYNTSLAEIAALFDSIYVSFYKDLGGIAGACLLGDRAFIDQAKIWIRRAGGNLYSLAPYVVAARQGLKTHLPSMTDRRTQAIWLAEQLNAIDAFQTWPSVPQTNMFRLRVNKRAEDVLPKISQWMQDNDCAIIGLPYEQGETHFSCELTVGDAFDQLTLEQWQHKLTSFKCIFSE